MGKRIIYTILLLFIITSSAYAVRLPGKGKFKDITEYIREIQEEDLWNSRDPAANRKASEDKRPWVDTDIFDMETTLDVPPVPVIEWCLITCPSVIFGDDCDDWVT